jgi:hypothetical protein
VINGVEYPNAFHSQVHNTTERRWPAHEQDFGAVDWIFCKEHYELQGRQIDLYTDSVAVKYIFSEQAGHILQSRALDTKVNGV